jgi:hypothetical protein
MKNVITATSKIAGESGILWLTGSPPALPWVRESTVWVRSRVGPIKTGGQIEVYGWSILAPNAQRRNLNQDTFLRRVFYRRADEDGVVPPNAVDPRTLAPRTPGTRVTRSEEDS